MSEADQSFNIAPPLDLGMPAYVHDFVAPILKTQEDLQTFFENDLVIRIQSAKQNLTSKIRSAVKKFDSAMEKINGSIKFLLKKEEYYDEELFPDIFKKIEKIDERVTKIETDSSNFAANKNADKNVSQQGVSMNAHFQKIGKSTETDDKKPNYKKRQFIYGTAPSVLKVPKNYIIAVSKIPNSEAYDERWLENEIDIRLKHKILDIKVLRIEKVLAKISGAATKTFKVVLRTTDSDIKVDQVYDPELWPQGLKISRFRIVRKRTRMHAKFRAEYHGVPAAQGDSSQ